jgi:IS30 family transposase
MLTMENHKQLIYEQRCQIHALKKTEISQADIAKIIGVSQSTISREFKRNTGLNGYRHQQAQCLTNQRRGRTHKALKMTPQLIHCIEEKLFEKWSPEQISGWLFREKHQSLSHETIYRHIWQDKANNGKLYLYLRRKSKPYQSRAKKQAGRGFIKNRIGIEERPEVVDKKSRVGDWEIDLVIGKSHSGALVTIVERLTSYTVSTRVNDKSAATVTAATIALLLPLKNYVKTITADNGKEFAYHEEITEALKAPVYFADPYCSWQRGLNENTNGLLRQYWPKGTDFKKVSLEEVATVISQLNNRPRKKLKFKTPANNMKEYTALIAA